MHYAIGDVHGCYQAMKKLIGKIEREDADAQFILIGDVIDRGGETPEVLEWCMKNVTRDGKYQMLMGNHELMFMEWCSREWFPYCEGKKKSYEHAHYHADEDLKKAGLLTGQSVKKIFSFFRSLPIVKEKTVISPDGRQRIVLAHAWAKKEEMEEIRSGNRRPKEYFKTFLLDRAGQERDAAYDPEGKEILIHGHTPTTGVDVYENGGVPGRIVYRKHAVNIDCGLSHGSADYDVPANLAAICLENLKEYYAYSLEECYANMHFGDAEAVKRAVSAYKQKYHFSRPDLMRIDLIRQINGA